MGSSVTITNPIHPLYGQSVVVRQIRQVGKQTKVIVESPLGGFLSLPADETNLFVQETSVPAKDTSRLFEPKKLLQLSEWVRRRSKSLSEKFSCVPEDEEIKHKKANATKSVSSRHSSRKRRTQATPHQTDSPFGGQDALHNFSSRRPEQE